MFKIYNRVLLKILFLRDIYLFILNKNLESLMCANIQRKENVITIITKNSVYNVLMLLIIILKKQPTKERKYYKKSENRNSSIDVQKLKCQFKKNAASSKIIDSTESQHHSSQIHPASQHTTLFYDNREKEHKR